MKYYGSKEALKQAFNKVKNVSMKHKLLTEKCQPFSDELNDLKYCQFSLINILESGYITSQKEEIGFVFILDLNKGTVHFYKKNVDGTNKFSTEATLEEIMEFDDMPLVSLKEIISEMTLHYNDWFEKYSKIINEHDKLIEIKKDALSKCDYNIINKVNKLICDAEYEKRLLKSNRRVFYNRLKALDLIEKEEV
jgi:hypothetical protein